MAPSSPASSDSSGLSSAPPTPPQTPGRPTTPGRRDADAQSVEPLTSGTAQSTARSSQRGARAKRGSEAQATPQPKVKRGAEPKGDISSTPAATSDDPPAPRPQKKLTVKLTRKGNGQNGTPGASSASPPVEGARPLPPASSDSVQPPSSDFRAQLKGLADSEDEDDGGNVVKPKKRRGGGAAIADDDEEEEDAQPASTSASRTSIVLKRKRKDPSSDRPRRETSKKKFKKRTLSQPERTTDSDEDFVGQGDDSDEVMSDVGSEESASGGEDYAEKAAGLVDGDEDFAPVKSQKKQGGAKAAGKGAKKGKAEESSTASIRPPPKKGDASAGASSSAASKTAGPRKSSSKVEPKTVASTIRASAAATSTSTTSSPAGSRPLGAGQAGPAVQKRPPQLNKPKASLSMWDSLVGSSSKPAAPVQPPKPAQPAAAVKAKEDQKTGAEKEGEKGKDPNQLRATPAGGAQASSSLPRPLGISRPQGTPSSTSASQPGSSSHGHGHGHGNFRDSTISIHVTPGLNGQHWDKAAYRSLRLADKERYRLPAPEDLFDLLEDAEVIVGFEEEWRAKRIMAGAGAGGQARYASSKATQYGAGRDYARGTVKELLKGRRKAPAANANATANGSTEGGTQTGEESKQLTT